MKSLILVSTLMLTCTMHGIAGEGKLPDLSKVFPDEIPFSKNLSASQDSYSYATDLAYTDLEKTLLKYLGGVWKEQKIDGKTRQKVEQLYKKHGGALMGYKLFASARYPKLIIDLRQIETEVAGKKSLVQVIVRKGKRDQSQRPLSGSE